MDKTIRDTCPYCQQMFKIKLELELKTVGLTSALFKPHDTCPEFLIFLDTNGAVRGTQTIDSKVEDKNAKAKEIEKYVQLFEDIENDSAFYHILDISNKFPQNQQKAGVITAKKVEFHNFLRSPFYKEWINKFKEDKEEFRMLYLKETIISTVNLYDMFIFTIGLDTAKLEQNMKIPDVNSFLQYIKGKVVGIGEKILSMQES